MKIKWFFLALFLLCRITVFGAVTVVSQPVESGEVRDILRFSGEVKPVVETIVTSDVAGPVEKILVEIGDPVKQGQAIVQIDDIRFVIAVRQSEAALNIARQKEDETRKDFERNKILREKNVLNSKAFDIVESAYLSSQQTVKRAKADLELAKLNLDRTVIRAPINGYFVSKDVFLGQRIAPGTVLGRVVDLEKVFVEAKIPESEISDVLVGQKCIIKHREGRVAHIDLYADSSRAFLVKILVPNSEKHLKANMFVKGGIVRKHHRDVPVIPISAIVSRDNRTFVFVAEAEKAVKRFVELVAREGEIGYYTGVNLGEHLIVVGQQALQEGEAIQFAEKPQTSQNK